MFDFEQGVRRKESGEQRCSQVHTHVKGVAAVEGVKVLKRHTKRLLPLFDLAQ